MPINRPRIISLLPSATEIVCSLGLMDQLVGVTHECDYPTGVESKPKVTRSYIPPNADSRQIDELVRQQRSQRASLYSLDFDRARALVPDLIITQTLCDVCAVDDVEVRRFVSALGATNVGTIPRVIHLEPTCLPDVLQSIHEVGAAAGVPDVAETVIVELRRRIDRVRAAAKQLAHHPRVVVLEWLDPLFSSGHWTPELVEIAGGVEPLAQTGQRSRRISTDELIAADPDMILIACCGFSVQRTMQDVPAFLAQPGISSLRCVRSKKFWLTDGSAYFSRPGPRLVDSLEILAHLIAPNGQSLPPSLQPLPAL